jgi:hypothetical protein
MNDTWQQKVLNYCMQYNLPIDYFINTLNEPKVIPMIRGKAFEFTAMLVLQDILDDNIWTIDKPVINAQLGMHDIDVRVIHKRTGTIINIECKLAKKEGYKISSDGFHEIRIKCMRSRTLGKAKVKELAPKLNVSKKLLSIHSDQYLPKDFDILITSIGNSFYRTNKETSLFEWKPNEAELLFLRKIGLKNDDEAKDFAFGKMYVAKSTEIAILNENEIICTRRKCPQKRNCGFIPNYPIIKFDPSSNRPTSNWLPVEDIESLLLSYING